MVPAQTERPSRTKILEAARDTLLSLGMTGWTIERVAETAGCAKGLVLYHFGSKQDLRQAVARLVRNERVEARCVAVSLGGAGGLDRLWDRVVSDWKAGRTALWLSLVANQESRELASLTEGDQARFSAAARSSLDLAADQSTAPHALDRMNGFELALLQGRDVAEVREAYDRYWLDVITSGP